MSDTSIDASSSDEGRKRHPLAMETLVSLCAARGFIYPASEIYGGIAGFWDYGPLGVELKNNLKQLIVLIMLQFLFPVPDPPTASPEFPPPEPPGPCVLV